MKFRKKAPSLLLDRLSFTFPIDNDHHRGIIKERVRHLTERANASTSAWKGVKHVKFLGEKAKGKYKYHQNYQITLESTDSSQVVYVSFRPLIDTHNFLRIEFNPSHYRQDEQEKLWRLFIYLFGRSNVNSFYHGCSVTKIDVAIDMLDQEIDFIMSYPNIRTSSMRYSNNVLVEQVLGHSKGRTSIKAYNKLEERRNRGFNLSRKKPWTRIEMRLRDLRCSIQDLEFLANPLGRLKFFAWDLPDWLGKKFIRLIHTQGLPSALQTRTEGMREFIKEGLRDIDISIFNSRELYKQWPDAMQCVDFLKPR